MLSVSKCYAQHNTLHFPLCHPECTHLGGGQCPCLAAIGHYTGITYSLRTFLFIFMPASRLRIIPSLLTPYNASCTVTPITVTWQVVPCQHVDMLHGLACQVTLDILQHLNEGVCGGLALHRAVLPIGWMFGATTSHIHLLTKCSNTLLTMMGGLSVLYTNTAIATPNVITSNLEPLPLL